MDAKAKIYSKGEPDMELKCKLGDGYIDVLATELKNPNKLIGLLGNQISDVYETLRKISNLSAQLS